MVGWHIYGKQNLSTETYRTTPEKFMAKAQAMVDKYTVRTETDQDSGGAPPPAATSTCSAAVELLADPRAEKGKTYRCT
jgi:cytochrome c oxidase subunit 2